MQVVYARRSESEYPAEQSGGMFLDAYLDEKK